MHGQLFRGMTPACGTCLSSIPKAQESRVRGPCGCGFLICLSERGRPGAALTATPSGPPVNPYNSKSVPFCFWQRTAPTCHVWASVSSSICGRIISHPSQGWWQDSLGATITTCIELVAARVADPTSSDFRPRLSGRSALALSCLWIPSCWLKQGNTVYSLKRMEKPKIPWADFVRWVWGQSWQE